MDGPAGKATLLIFLAGVLGLIGGCTGEREGDVVQLRLGETIRQLGSDDLDVESRAQNRLTAIGAPALPALAAAMRQEAPPVRVGVVEVVSEMEGTAAADILIAAVKDSSDEVRADAALALRLRRGSAVEAALIATLDDPSARVRQRAAVACGQACASEAGIGALLRHGLSDPDPVAAWAAAASLIRIREGDPALVHSVDAAIAADAPAALSESEVAHQERAAVLLATIGDQRAIPILERLVNSRDDNRVRLRAIYALGSVGGPSAVPVLQALLNEPPMAGYAYDALRRAGERGVPGAQAALDAYTGPRPAAPLPPPVW
jgi:HEAT repeat protein